MLADGRNYARGSRGEVLTEANIATVYGAEVVIMSHPQGGGTPVVLPVSDGGGSDHTSLAEENERY